MTPTVYQKPEIRDANDNIIQQGAFGKNTALANATNDGWIDYVANDLEFLYALAKDEVVPVLSLPASGQLNKTYLLTTTGVSYRWSGTQWVAVSSSEAVGRAETAANLAEQWATKTSGTVDGTEYSAKYYAQQAEASADDAQDVADDMATHLVQIDKNTGGVAKNSKRISNIEKLLQGNLYDYDTDDDSAYTKTVPSGALPYAGIEQIGGKTVVWNQYVYNGNFADGIDGWEKVGGNYPVTISASDNALSVTVTGTPSNYYNLGVRSTSAHSYPFVQGHKYYFSLEAYSPYDVTISTTSNSTVGTGSVIVASTGVNTWTRGANIFTSSGTGDYAPYFAPNVNWQSFQANDVYKIRNVMVCDLTLMFGAGNEPTTIEQFREMFPASYYPYNAGTLLSAGVTSVVSKDSNDDALQTLSIPAEVQALEGYGWSAGSVYNYVDFERKVFVQNVGRVDLGTLNYSMTTSGLFSVRFFRAKVSVNSITPGNILSDLYSLIASQYITGPQGANPSPNLVMAIAPTNTLYFNNTSYTDTTAFKSAMSGVMLYYELATPIETDISQYLTDNIIEVGAGGTLTFENSNGDDYHIPVPSDVTYMIDLQEAISNG